MERNNKTAVLHLKSVVEPESEDCGKVPGAKTSAKLKPDFSIVRYQDCFRISDVAFPFTDASVVDILTEGTDGQVVPLPMYHRIFDALYRRRLDPALKDDVERVRVFLADRLYGRTSTATYVTYVTYDSNKDLITHRYPNGRVDDIIERVHGREELLKDAIPHPRDIRINHDPESIYLSLLYATPEEADEVYKWISGAKDTLLVCPRSLPKEGGTVPVCIGHGAGLNFICAVAADGNEAKPKLLIRFPG